MKSNDVPERLYRVDYQGFVGFVNDHGNETTYATFSDRGDAEEMIRLLRQNGLSSQLSCYIREDLAKGPMP